MADFVKDGLAHLGCQVCFFWEVTQERAPVDADAVGDGAVVARGALGEGDAFVEAVDGAAQAGATPLPGRGCAGDEELDVVEGIGVAGR